MLSILLKTRPSRLAGLLLMIAGFWIGDAARAQSPDDVQQAFARCEGVALRLSNFVMVGIIVHSDRPAIGLGLRKDLAMDPAVAGVLDCFRPVPVVVTFESEITPSGGAPPRDLVSDDGNIGAGPVPGAHVSEAEAPTNFDQCVRCLEECVRRYTECTDRCRSALRDCLDSGIPPDTCYAMYSNCENLCMQNAFCIGQCPCAGAELPSRAITVPPEGIYE